jgi:hypothetical protein
MNRLRSMLASRRSGSRPGTRSQVSTGRHPAQAVAVTTSAASRAIASDGAKRGAALLALAEDLGADPADVALAIHRSIADIRDVDDDPTPIEWVAAADNATTVPTIPVNPGNGITLGNNTGNDRAVFAAEQVTYADYPVDDILVTLTGPDEHIAATITVYGVDSNPVEVLVTAGGVHRIAVGGCLGNLRIGVKVPAATTAGLGVRYVVQVQATGQRAAVVAD